MSMDRKIEKSRRPLVIKTTVSVVLVLILSYFTMGVLQDSAISTYRVDKAKVSISAVSSGTFEDFIPVRGTVTPLKSVFLDAIEGGRVENIFVENGAIVEAGQVLVELSNTALQLDVIQQEALVTEQINNLRNTRLNMEQEKLQLKSSLVELDYQIKQLERKVGQLKVLVADGIVSTDEYASALDELDYRRQRREITIERQQQDNMMRKIQIESTESNVASMQRNLQFAHKNLENLVVKAPISGRLSSFDAELGQSKNRGETLGQIDVVDEFKLTVQIDEFYVRRVAAGQPGLFTMGGKEYELRISRVYPQVNNGQFEIDMEFVGELPPDIYRGQTLQPRVQLGDASKALLIPRGGFFQDTGGNWVYVLDAEGKQALKREISLGRRNAEYFEVLEGLEAGEQVITSAYTGYEEMDRIEFN